uniref:NADH dehydrogenase subunit 6 n=1 Tax=Caprella mutica TaxID=380747 RepID=E0XH09_9CRUS|nr:NADH dehydrogenase subunit 6 [Caprella mutica]ADA69729.1 NADH dehydrogenase subunit 6 [Caprella mutica]
MACLSTMTLLLFMLFMFVITNHPLTMGLALMLTSLAMGIILSLNGPSAWIAYMLVMIFVSGMMIIIMYMSSLSSNENISPSTFMKKTYTALLILSLAMFFPLKQQQLNLPKSAHYFSDSLFTIIYKTYNQLMNSMTTLIIFYLLIVLIVAVNIVKVSKTPLRSFGE